jgi:hypothetical protein
MHPYYISTAAPGSILILGMLSCTNDGRAHSSIRRWHTHPLHQLQPLSLVARHDRHVIRSRARKCLLTAHVHRPLALVQARSPSAGALTTRGTATSRAASAPSPSTGPLLRQRRSTASSRTTMLSSPAPWRRQLPAEPPRRAQRSRRWWHYSWRCSSRATRRPKRSRPS